MRKVVTIISLEFYALILAYAQSLGGVRTDEAKYLLNIPYPHPPFVRWVLSQTEFLPFQEIFWRIVFATVLIQAVWMIWKTSKNIIPCIVWLFSSAVILQTGTIMMAPLTAVQGLIFVIIYNFQKNSKYKILNIQQLILIAFFWLISLFTAYQAVLYLPIVMAIFWRMKIPVFHKIIYIIGPLVVLGLYILTNPFVVASIGLVGIQNVTLPFKDALLQAGTTLLISGSVVASIFGIVGMLKTKCWPLVFSLVLVLLFVIISHRSYYAILFVPLLVGGLWTSGSRVCIPLLLIFSAFYGMRYFPLPSPSVARIVLQNIPDEGVLLIDGDFGHEWQYESTLPVRRYRSSDVVIRPIPLDKTGDAVTDLRLWIVPE